MKQIQIVEEVGCSLSDGVVAQIYDLAAVRIVDIFVAYIK